MDSAFAAAAKYVYVSIVARGGGLMFIQYPTPGYVTFSYCIMVWVMVLWFG